jgi:hypothetical protein
MSTIIETTRPCVQCPCDSLAQATKAGACDCGHNASQHPHVPTEAGIAKQNTRIRYTDLLFQVRAEMFRQDDLGYDTAHDRSHGLGHLISILDGRVEQADDGTSQGELERTRQNLIEAAAVAIKAIIQVDHMLEIGEQRSVTALPEIVEGDGY